MGMKLASKLNGTSMVKSKLFELIKGVFNIIGPVTTQKDSVKSHRVICTNEFAEVCRCAASNCCPGLMSSQYLISIKCAFHCLAISWEKKEKKKWVWLDRE
eukprot:112495-Pelagomonas_calceolata.AAC.1